MATLQNNFPGCHFERYDSKLGSIYFPPFCPNQKKLTFTKISESAAKTEYFGRTFAQKDWYLSTKFRLSEGPATQ